jgi:excisionase family DNA binding protein
LRDGSCGRDGGRGESKWFLAGGDFACKPVEKKVQEGAGWTRRPRVWRGDMAGLAQVVVREVMDIRQAAEYLGISGDTLYRYASEGVVPAFKLGNRWRFKKDLLDTWMDQQSGVKPAVKTAVKTEDAEQKKPVGKAR